MHNAIGLVHIVHRNIGFIAVFINQVHVFIPIHQGCQRTAVYSFQCGFTATRLYFFHQPGSFNRCNQGLMVFDFMALSMMSLEAHISSPFTITVVWA